MQPLFNGMLCAEISLLPTLLTSFHISQGVSVCACVHACVFTVVCRMHSAWALCAASNTFAYWWKRLFIVKNKVYRLADSGIVFFCFSGHVQCLCVTIFVCLVCICGCLDMCDFPGETLAKVIENQHSILEITFKLCNIEAALQPQNVLDCLLKKCLLFLKANL